MASRETQTAEVTRLRVREFNRLHIGGGVRLIKCEACGKLTDHGAIIDRDVVERGVSGQLEKTGYERWTLCSACSGTIMEKVGAFTEEIFDDAGKLEKQ